MKIVYIIAASAMCFAYCCLHSDEMPNKLTEEKIDKLMKRLELDYEVGEEDEHKQIIEQSGIANDPLALKILLDKYYPATKKRYCIEEDIIVRIIWTMKTDVVSGILEALKEESLPEIKVLFCGLISHYKERRVYNYLYKQLDDRRELTAYNNDRVSRNIYVDLRNMSDFKMPEITPQEQNEIKALKRGGYDKGGQDLAIKKLRAYLRDKGLVDPDIDDKSYTEDDAIKAGKDSQRQP